jgi:hypothetical protein
MNENLDKHVVYALVDPRTDRVHYVGRTRGDPRRRATRMAIKSQTPEKRAWMEDLIEADIYPQQVILEHTDERNISARERWWIEEMLRRGEPLTNHYEGGTADGLVGEYIRLPIEELTYLKQLGEGSASRGVRELLRRLSGGGSGSNSGSD